jgi:hypothetical protein
MMKKVIVPFVGLVLGLFVACSNDSDSANSQVSGPVDSTVAKLDSVSYVASQGSCDSEGALQKIMPKDDSIHLYVNKNGSAVLKEKMGIICPEQGELSKISIEKEDDTLLVSIEFYEYPPRDTVIVYNDSLGKNDTLFVGRPRRKCMCYSDYEIDVPAEFTSAKFVGLKSSFNNNTYVFSIAYVKE